MQIWVTPGLGTRKCLPCKGNCGLRRSSVTHRTGTCPVKGSKRVRRVVVSADGTGVVSHAGVGLLREMAEYTGLVGGVSGL